MGLIADSLDMLQSLVYGIELNEQLEAP